MRRLLATVTVLTAVAVLAGGLFASPAGAAPEAPNLIGPADAGTLTANPLLSWEPVATATRYKVQISTVSNFSSTVYDVTTYNTQATPPADLPQTTLYWRVRGIDATNANGPYSSTWSFNKAAGPAPVPIQPQSGDELVFPGEPLLFSWEPVAGAKTYEFQIDDEDLFTAPIAVSVSTKNTSYALTNPQTIGQTFYWRVRWLSPANVPSAWSDPLDYTMTWPTVPTLVAPANATMPEIEEVVFEWEPVDGAATYDIQVGLNDEFTSGVVINGNVQSTRYSPPTTLNNDAYFWRVRAKNVAGGTTGWSQTWVFTRSWPAPDQLAGPSPTPPVNCESETEFRIVQLCRPANGSVVTEFVFEWTPVRLGSRYQVQVSPNQFFASSVTGYTTNHTTFSPPSPLAAGTYYWRVRPIDDGGGIVGLWSATAMFEYQPQTVSLMAPADGASVGTPMLTWERRPGSGVYEVTIWGNDDSVAETATVSNTAYVPQTLDPVDGPFTWSVKQVGGPDPDESLHRTFTLVAPSGGASPDPTPALDQGEFYAPTLTWQPVTGADRYEVWGAPTGDPFTQLPQAGNLTSAAFAYSGYDLDIGEWSFEVRAFDGATPIATGLTGSFVVLSNLISRPLAPAHCPPLSPCADIYDTPTFAWEPLARDHDVHAVPVARRQLHQPDLHHVGHPQHQLHAAVVAARQPGGPGHLLVRPPHGRARARRRSPPTLIPRARLPQTLEPDPAAFALQTVWCSRTRSPSIGRTTSAPTRGR